MKKKTVVLLCVLYISPMLLYFLIGRTIFVMHAEKTSATVISIHALNFYKGKLLSPFTRYEATVEFDYNGIHRFNINAGEIREFNQPISFSNYKIGDKISIVYNQKNPNKAYKDSFDDVWGIPLGISIVMSFLFYRVNRAKCVINT